MGKLESKIESDAREYARKRGWLVYKLETFGNAGSPDKIFCKKGTVLFVEFKRGSEGRVSANQEVEIELLKHHGFEIYICESYKLFKELLDIFDGIIERENE